MSEHSNDQDLQKQWNPDGVRVAMNQDLHLVELVKEALLRQTESAGIDISVSAEGDAVRLTGIVDTLAHRTQAERIAAGIPGVRHVDNDIAVADEEMPSDRELQQLLTSKITKHERLQHLGVQVQKGVATIVGHTDTHENITHAKHLIEDTPGVREVRIRQVKVGENRKDDDADVSRAAEAKLRELGFDDSLFEVYCDAGTLFVKGFVPTKEDKSRIKTHMHRISGVHKLVTTLVTDDQYGGEIH